MNNTLNEFLDDYCNESSMKKDLNNDVLLLSNNKAMFQFEAMKILRNDRMITYEISDIIQMNSELLYKKELIENRKEEMRLLRKKKDKRIDINQIIDSYMNVFKTSEEIYKQHYEHVEHQESRLKKMENAYNCAMNDQEIIIDNNHLNKKEVILTKKVPVNSIIKTRNPLISKVLSQRTLNDSSRKNSEQTSFEEKSQTTNDNSFTIKKFINYNLAKDNQPIISINPIKKKISMENIDKCEHKFALEEELLKTYNNKSNSNSFDIFPEYENTLKTSKDVSDYCLTKKNHITNKSTEKTKTSNKSTISQLKYTNKQPKEQIKASKSSSSFGQYLNIKKPNMIRPTSVLNYTEKNIDKTKLRKGRNIEYYSNRFKEQKLLGLKVRSASSTFLEYSIEDKNTLNDKVLSHNESQSSFINNAKTNDCLITNNFQSSMSQEKVEKEALLKAKQPVVSYKGNGSNLIINKEEECPRINLIMNQMKKENCLKARMKRAPISNKYDDIMSDYKRIYNRIQEKKDSAQISIQKIDYIDYYKPILILIKIITKAFNGINVISKIKQKITDLLQYDFTMLILKYIKKRIYIKDLNECFEAVYKHQTQRKVIKIHDSESDNDDISEDENPTEHEQLMIHYMKNLNDIKKISNETKSLEYNLMKIAESFN